MVLFRGKKTREYGGEWIVSSFILSTPKGVMLGVVDNNIDVASLDIDIVEENIRWYPIQLDTLCQATEYTTFIDGSDERYPVFDKDIVEVESYGSLKERYAVWYMGEGSSFIAVPWSKEAVNSDATLFVNYPVNFKEAIDWKDFAFMMQDPYGDLKSIKVIGNYIDNPELFSPDAPSATPKRAVCSMEHYDDKKGEWVF